MSPSGSGQEHSALRVLAEELRHARAAKGLSQDQLGDLINFSGSQVGMVEACRRVPSLDFARRCDEAMQTGGVLARMHPLVAGEAYPAWFRPFAHHEAEAAALRTFELAVVPGLLQTEEYARTLLSARVGTPGVDVDQRVAARMERQVILERDTPPLLWVLLDEGVLRRLVGGREVMRHQIEYLAELTERPNVIIQVIAAEVGAHDGVNGSFVIADFADAPSVVYLESALTGWLVERRDQVESVRAIYDGLRSEALPRAASAQLVKEAAKLWTI
jgi:transcriptional regulator with XRE-family HTH domain